jgi:heme-degrading monooxygenase HmoA
MVEARWVSFVGVDPAREYLALITYLPRKSYWSIFSFIRQSNAIQKQLKGSRGLIGYSLRAQLLGKKAWTLSVWEDERALNEFVRKSPHVDTMRKVSLGEARKFVRWKLLGSEVPPKWDDALAHLR